MLKDLYVLAVILAVFTALCIVLYEADQFVQQVDRIERKLDIIIEGNK